MIKIAHDDEQRPEGELKALMERAADFISVREGMQAFDCEVSLFFADEEEIRQMNAQYRDIDQPTDVLSFPMFDDRAALDSGAARPDNLVRFAVGEIEGSAFAQPQPAMLGDIVICREIAARQAEEYGHSEEREMAFLFTHGLLHLLGYDHEGEEASTMRTVEKEVMAMLGLNG